MAAATRGLRPLLGPLRPAARAPRTTTPGLYRAQSNVRDQIRESTKRSYKEMKRGDVKAPSPSADMAAQTDMMRNRMLLPGTFVRLPISKWPRNPVSFLKYLWAVTFTTGQNTLMTWGLRLTSMPKGTFRPAFKPGTRRIVPTAAALHRRLNEAVAAGDLTALREVCHEPLYDMLAKAIDGRKRGEKVEWELVESHKRMFLPRMISHRATIIPDSRWAQQSAVVRFDTTQKVTRRDASGKVVKGGVRAQRKTENMVLMRSVDSKGGYVPEEWKVWGFEDEMTLESWQEMERGKKALESSGLEKRVRELRGEAARK